MKRNSKQMRKETRKRLKDAGLGNRLFVNPTCTRCGITFHIRVNDKSIYTSKYFKNYICLICQ